MVHESHWVWADDVNVLDVVGGMSLTIGAIALGLALKKLYNYIIKRRRQEEEQRNEYLLENRCSLYMAI